MLYHIHICDRFISLALVLLFLAFNSSSSFAQGTSFTYQGKLSDSGTPVNGNYDLQFKLYDTVIVGTGTQQGSTLTLSTVTVTAGIFTVQLDFGACASCFNGAPRFLEIAVKPTSGGTFTTLGPRQALTSNPYAIKSLSATSADSLTGILGPLNGGTGIGTLPVGGTFLRSNGAGWSASGIQVSDLPAGSPSYVQNTTSPQASTSFNISGDGTVGGTLGGNIINATTQYNIAGSRVLSMNSTNLFVGSNAGNANTTGDNNSFFGRNAGFFNTIGGNNSFFGAIAGGGNSSGSQNSYFGVLTFNNSTTGNENSGFGYGAGASNSTGNQNVFVGAGAGAVNTTGSANSFFGLSAGFTNTTGGNNTIIGSNANVGSGTLNFATAIGAGAIVSSSNTVVLGRGTDSVQIPGNLNVAGTLTGTFSVPATNVTGVLARANGGTGISSTGAAGNVLRSDGTNWTSSALQASDIPNLGAGYIQNQSSGQQFASFSIVGEGTVSGTLTGLLVNATAQYNIGGNRLLSVYGTENLFVGINAGTFNSTGFRNSFVGYQAGAANTTGSNNSFFGSGAGSASTGGNNSFFGTGAGGFNTTGDSNSFFGSGAGSANSTGGQNSFFGWLAGTSNTAGTSNSFFGKSAGFNNSTGSGNSFFGLQAGVVNATGSFNTIIGFAADVGVNNLSNATAIGANAVVSQSNSLVLGNNVNVGIGTTAPEQKLHVVGNEILSTGANSGFKFRDRGSTSFADDWVWYSMGNVARLFRVGPGDLLTITTAGIVTINGLSTEGVTPLCRNPSNQISTCSSSIRYKQNIHAFQAGLSLIQKLRPVSFNWRANNLADLGLVAEEVAKVEPLLTTANDKGEIEGVKYDRVGVVLVNAVQEQQRQIEAQQKQLDEQNQVIKKQQEQMQKQQAELDALKMLVCSQNPTAEICKLKQ